MLSKNRIKFIQSLERKKFREESGLFIAEGGKLVNELIKANFQIEFLITAEENPLLKQPDNCEIISVTEDEMKKISLLKTPSHLMAIVKQPNPKIVTNPLPTDPILVLDAIQDPGNFGTIIRLASWFGIKSMVCSEDCVDCFNPKVIQSTMGAIAHVNIYYTHLQEFLNIAIEVNRTIYGTYLEGENIYSAALEKDGIIILGNEGKGIRKELEKFVTQKLYIPSFAAGNIAVESLNVSTAAAIVCSEFKRRIY